MIRNEREIIMTKGSAEIRTSAMFRDLDRALEHRDMGSEGKWVGGYAMVFAPRQSIDLGGFVETWAPDAFAESRMGDWKHVHCGFNFDPYDVLGTTTSGSLRLEPDRIGLDWMVNPTWDRRDVRELVERRDLRYSAITFRVPLDGGDEWVLSELGYVVRRIKAAQLLKVEPILGANYYPHTGAEPDVSVAMQSLADQVKLDLDEVTELAASDKLASLFS